MHNGIIENYLTLKDMLREKGHDFKTETDTEIVAHLIEEYQKEGLSFEEAVRESVQQLKGIFALSIISSDEPDKIIAVREGPPVVIGLATANFLSHPTFPQFCNTHEMFFISAKRKLRF